MHEGKLQILLQNELLKLQTNVTIRTIPGKQWKGEEFCSCWGQPASQLSELVTEFSLHIG